MGLFGAAARVGLEQLVRSWGFLAESAGDGEEALAKVTAAVDAAWHQKTGYVPVTFGGYEESRKQGFYDKAVGADTATSTRTPAASATRRAGRASLTARRWRGARPRSATGRPLRDAWPTSSRTALTATT